MLNPGDKAPPFELPDADMHIINSNDFLGNQNLVIYFYPKDDTTGCTIEALELSDLMDEFSALDTQVIGISRDNCVSHAAFRDKHGLTVQLLADTEGEVCNDYDVWREKEKNGEKRMGILRSTFIIDKAGIIREALYDVKPKGHATQVLEKVKKIT
ncbi:MAG: peroxiredoxin [Candidatus Thiodiazotropha endolucinida]|uniref:thioredoxin-dependent peroxiredoxin n=1 Tax=Candidatus Thiodiazotropha taylori TaxID=2792791 RepID=A0A9E4JUK7_9GAMM|nr:peroxiredoxin [Candidatus Thiodiazotropha taylori]MBT3037672.1 peroxiredoxin [Candidatus Thiodiazotropha sp. (ex Codakia orbicularis)]MBT3091761.1 peroxiredoxin [Candidatus Thiodiazotropha sp. (ex Lucina pensylvanica)]MCG7863075.1 peroxiredoxin [Candidatus Thiodiazotropha endolucinida]MBT3043091.1 peroxiredoxin [Candidatus Thiodiazotropha sp. (ex Codakia orbicularis)]